VVLPYQEEVPYQVVLPYPGDAEVVEAVPYPYCYHQNRYYYPVDTGSFQGVGSYRVEEMGFLEVVEVERIDLLLCRCPRSLGEGEAAVVGVPSLGSVVS